MPLQIFRKKGITQWYGWKALSAYIGRGKSGNVPSSVLYQRKSQMEKVRKEETLEGRREKELVKQDIKFSPIGNSERFELAVWGVCVCVWRVGTLILKSFMINCKSK